MDGPLAAIDAHSAGSFLLIWIGQALVLGTALAGLTWLVTRLLRRRVHPALEGALWSIVLVKFLFPVGPLWSLSLPEVCDHIAMPAAAMNGARETDTIPVDLIPVAEAPAQPARQQDFVDSVTRTWHWPTWMLTAYIVGALGLFVRRMCSYQALLGRAWALPRADARICGLVGEVCRRLGVRRAPSVRISDEAPAPFVMGLFRPLLVLSHRHLVRPDELETVVVHEVAHLRRGDLFVRLLQWIAGTLLFFWPVVAWVNRRIDVARECACDEWALRYGKLTAGEYARCLLTAMQPVGVGRLAYCPPGMAANHKTIERRIDMILDSPDRSWNRRTRRRLTLAFLLSWAGFTLTGTVDAARSADSDTWPATEEAVKEHAIQLYDLVADHEAADFDGNGVLSYTEKTAYLVALAMQNTEAFMAEFPYADRNHSARLDCLEVFAVVHAITRIAYLDRRIGAEIEGVRDAGTGDVSRQIGEIHRKYAPEAMTLLHEALDAQQWVLDHATREPSAQDLDNLWSIIRRVEGPPGSFSNRMLNHGGPAEAGRGCKPSCGNG